MLHRHEPVVRPLFEEFTGVDDERVGHHRRSDPLPASLRANGEPFGVLGKQGEEGRVDVGRNAELVGRYVTHRVIAGHAQPPEGVTHGAGEEVGRELERSGVDRHELERDPFDLCGVGLDRSPEVGHECRVGPRRVGERQPHIPLEDDRLVEVALRPPGQLALTHRQVAGTGHDRVGGVHPNRQLGIVGQGEKRLGSGKRVSDHRGVDAVAGQKVEADLLTDHSDLVTERVELGRITRSAPCGNVDDRNVVVRGGSDRADVP